MATPFQERRVSRTTETLSIGVVGIHAVPEVEDMPRAPVRASQDPPHALADEVVRPVEHRGIEIPLHAFALTDPRPPFIERNAPVEPDDVAASLADVFEKLSRADPEVDRGAVEVAQRLEDGRACVA